MYSDSNTSACLLLPFFCWVSVKEKANAHDKLQLQLLLPLPLPMEFTCLTWFVYTTKQLQQWLHHEQQQFSQGQYQTGGKPAEASETGPQLYVILCL